MKSATSVSASCADAGWPSSDSGQRRAAIGAAGAATDASRTPGRAIGAGTALVRI
jgi:hypothetical protein